MTRPLIGLTLDAADDGRMQAYPDYAISIEKAGAIPVGIPFAIDHASIPALLERLDGILFTGGNDLDPGLYAEKRHPRAIPLAPQRQSFELELLARAERMRLPVLGICLGSQLMNVHRGGSLHQFLPDLPRENPLEHRSSARPSHQHPADLDATSLLGRAIGRAQIPVNTYHKQAINRLGRGLRIVGRAPDGVIEAIEDPSLPLFAGVQWHPERLHGDEHHLAVFRLLVDKAAAAGREMRCCG
jgi:putative glutamine amidotransferase